VAVEADPTPGGEPSARLFEDPLVSLMLPGDQSTVSLVSRQLVVVDLLYRRPHPFLELRLPERTCARLLLDEFAPPE